MDRPWYLLFPFPIPPTQKKNQYLLPESDTTDSLIPPKTPEQTREKTPIIRSLMKLRLIMLTKPSFHLPTKPNTTYLSYTGWSEHIVTTPVCTGVHTHHVDVVVGWSEGNHSLTPVRVPSRSSVPHSPPWCRFPSPFKFTQEPCFLFFSILVTFRLIYSYS